MSRSVIRLKKPFENASSQYIDGSTDMRIGCKLQITHQDGYRPKSALIAALAMPVGATAWTSNQVDTILNYNYGWDIADRVSLGGSTGTWWTKSEGDQYTVMHQSAVVGLGITEQLGCYLEWFGLFFDGSVDARPNHYLNTGLTYLITNDFQVDWRIGSGLTESADDFFTGVGFAIRK
ncbi:MAG: transporter [Pirellulales bacterium]|nr:transporter [Pirellulales bacterium]